MIVTSESMLTCIHWGDVTVSNATLDIFVSSSLFTVCKTALVESHVFTTKSSAALLLHKSFWNPHFRQWTIFSVFSRHKINLLKQRSQQQLTHITHVFKFLHLHQQDNDLLLSLVWNKIMNIMTMIWRNWTKHMLMIEKMKSMNVNTIKNSCCLSSLSSKWRIVLLVLCAV